MKKLYFFLFLFFFIKSTAQYTAIPDPYFELALIDLGIDTDGLNGHVLTSNINTLTDLYIQAQAIVDFTGIEGFTALTIFDIHENYPIFNLDLSNNLNLETFICTTSNVQNINFSNNTSIKGILIDELFMFSTNFQIDVTNAINLEGLSFTNSPSATINTINTSTNVNLEYLNLYNNNITTIDVSNNPLLRYLYFDNNNVATLDVSNNPLLNYLNCNNNNLSSLNLSNNPMLQRLNCSNNNLISLTVKNGSNNLLNGTYPDFSNPSILYNRFNATNNPNLTCIYVDDVANCTANWLGIDATSQFVNTLEECNNLTTKVFDYSNLNIYPNPANGYFIVDKKDETIKSISIFDSSGKKLIDKTTNLNKVDISNLAKGLYLIRVETANNLISIKKIVVE